VLTQSKLERACHLRKIEYQHELTHAQRLEADAVSQQVNPGRSYDAR